MANLWSILGEVGHVEAICIAAADSAPMQLLASVEAIAGVGLRGDRYAEGTGFYSKRPTDPGAREVTLISAGQTASHS